MSSNSTPHDFMRFVHLRFSTSDGVRMPLWLEADTNLAGELAGVPRDARRDRAAQWLRDTGANFLDDTRSDPVYRQLREAVGALSDDSEPQTVRKLFLYLEARDLFGDGSEARRALLDRISDLLLAFYFAPSGAPDDLNDLRRVYIILGLLHTADTMGLSRTDLRGTGRHAEFLDRELGDVLGSPLALPGPIDSDFLSKFSVGVGDLLVVKEHIKYYEPSEIAHIENVMASERRERTHRRLELSEEIHVTELESEVERETELTTTERFELSDEASRTIKEEQQLTFGLSVSGKYGPTVEFGSEFQFGRRDSREETAKSSTSYAKEIVERSLERVRERVLRRRTTRILHELEETNIHAFEPPSENLVGIYQFVDKVCEAQVFDYGKREMFDLMVPEPASYLWHLRHLADGEENGLEEPVPPVVLTETVIPELTIVERDGTTTYERLAARYRADGIEPPPDERLTLSAGARHPEDGSGENDPSTLLLELNIPPGYRPVTARVSAIAHSAPDNKHELTLVGFAVLDRLSIRDIQDGRSLPRFVDGYNTDYLNPSTVPGISRTDEIMLFGMPDAQIELDASAVPEGSPLSIGVFGYDTKRYVVSVEVECELTESHLQEWRLKTFDKLAAAYEARLIEFQEQHARFQQQRRQQEDEVNADRAFGTAPSRSEETIRTELKKHCISIVTEDFFDRNDTPPVMDDTSDPPWFRFGPARERGAIVRFLEQAFEWQHIQYVFYPYFWVRTELWSKRFREDDPAHQYRQFHQAGWARVVVPVRRGYEDVLHYYLHTGNVWGGRDTPPRIGDPLSLSVSEEIRARTDEGVLQAIPTGQPWEVRVPTSLVYLRSESRLPRWRRIQPAPGDDPADHWEWRPQEPGD